MPKKCKIMFECANNKYPALKSSRRNIKNIGSCYKPKDVHSWKLIG